MLDEIIDYFTTPTYLSKPKERSSFVHKSFTIHLDKDRYICIQLSVAKNLNVREYWGKKFKILLYDNRVTDFRYENNVLTYVKFRKTYKLEFYLFGDCYFFKYEKQPKWITSVSTRKHLFSLPPNVPKIIIPNPGDFENLNLYSN